MPKLLKWRIEVTCQAGDDGAPIEGTLKAAPIDKDDIDAYAMCELLNEAFKKLDQ